MENVPVILASDYRGVKELAVAVQFNGLGLYMMAMNPYYSMSQIAGSF